jgi:hypothetical protein
VNQELSRERSTLPLECQEHERCAKLREGQGGAGSVMAVCQTDGVLVGKQILPVRPCIGGYTSTSVDLEHDVSKTEEHIQSRLQTHHRH